MFYKDNPWHKKVHKAFWGYIRDLFVYILPKFLFSKRILEFLYSGPFDYVFLVHPRRSQDYFIALPFLSVLRKFLNKRQFLILLTYFTPFVLSKTITKNGLKGAVVSSLYMPEYMLKNRKLTLLESKKLVEFSSKILKSNGVIGLGGWWPIVTKRGAFLSTTARENDCRITTGHTVTIMSIYLMILKIARISGKDIKDLKIALLGAGKIGSQVANVFLKKGSSTLGLIDVNSVKLNKTAQSLKNSFPQAQIDPFLYHPRSNTLGSILDKFHICVSATSSFNAIIHHDDIPENFIFIDDSRPESIPREKIPKNVAVLEGGLMKIKGISSNYDYGLGIDDNIFGCLAETYMLAADKTSNLKSTIGNICYDSIDEFLNFTESNDILVGDFKSRNKILKESFIRDLVVKRDQYLRVYDVL